MTVEAFAPAKINLTLHVIGQRSDGYHLLDSLVVFLDVGDRVIVEKALETSLTVTGPMAAGVPSDDSNLVRQAAALLGVTAKITLEKHLPAAAGIGGGSSDAAATIRALTRLYEMPLPKADAVLQLGADVPVCLHGALARMQGIGEQITPVAGKPDWPMILVNPRVLVPTGPVFQALTRKDNPPMPNLIVDWTDPAKVSAWLADQRNDLQAPAIASQPVIGHVLTDLEESEGCTLARMSGSGATCFGLYTSRESRDQAVAHLRVAHPDWWIVACQTAAAI